VSGRLKIIAKHMILGGG